MGNFYWTNFDYIWNDLDLVLRDWQRMVVEPKKQLASLPNYPHSDCWVDDDCNKLGIRFALAGYSKENISVKASKNVLRITAKGVVEQGVKFVHHGISKKDVDFSLNIDEAFNLKKAKTEFVDGLLSIVIPRAKEAELVELM